MEGKQVFYAKIEVELGFNGKWGTDDVLEALQDGLEGRDGIEAISVSEEKPDGV